MVLRRKTLEREREMMVSWILNLQVCTPNRSSTHWGSKFKQNKLNKRILGNQWLYEKDKPSPPCTVTIERLYNPSKREKRWDDDNWVSACKGIRDSLADLLVPGLSPGQADNPKHGITFEYDQLTSVQKGVRIVIKTKQEIEKEQQQQ